MKICIVGCGALGSFYGAKLCRAGAEVNFLLRSDFDVVRRRGVIVRSPDGDFQVQPRCAEDPASVGACDLVVIGLKTTANRELKRLVTPLVGEETAILTLQNGLGNEEALAEEFRPERVLGGLCFVCLNRISPGVIQHSAHGDVLLGEFLRPPQARTHLIADLFHQAGIRCKVTENLERAHWQKLVWNIPFNGLGVASAAGLEAVRSGHLADSTLLSPCLATDQLLRDPAWLRLVRELMTEVVTAARLLGFELSDDVIEDRIAQTREMGAYKASTVIDFERGYPLEREGLFVEPLRRALAVGVQMPRLSALCSVLAKLDPGGTGAEPLLSGRTSG